MRRILIIDDDPLFLDTLRKSINQDFPALEVITHSNPVAGLRDIGPDIDLLLIDLEMPGMDGSKLLHYAKHRGVDKSRIIVLSGCDAEDLHRIFPMGTCLAVLNKHEARQRQVLRMVLASMQTGGGKTPTGKRAADKNKQRV
ncbi:response regulator receiver domain-containing protein [Geothermobacter ehrlichii]|uniref:Response regulator receiver domain-containing protein n=1 Tax=Geothermobacter ehrlichii TaxID=213224 RepID=A0A5D3WLK6_9BACT|nr:response regulator [Geothermobacter ehrlichii]TYO98887.1 response regulator receiver domain-containing protein [Geothermobacter ehrlichii]